MRRRAVEHRYETLARAVNERGGNTATVARGKHPEGGRYTRLIVTDAVGTLLGIATSHDDGSAPDTLWMYRGGAATRVGLSSWTRHVGLREPAWLSPPSTPRGGQ